MIGIKPVLPRKKLNPPATERELNRYLSDFMLAVQTEMQRYPPAQPWNSRPPTRGPRAGGRRTGNYGRGWRIRRSGAGYILENQVGYAVYVGGPRDKDPGQARFMAARGWVSIQDVAAKHRKEKLPKFSRVLWTG